MTDWYMSEEDKQFYKSLKHEFFKDVRRILTTVLIIGVVAYILYILYTLYTAGMRWLA